MIGEMQMLTTWEDIYRKVYKDYLHDDVELCGSFFDFEVSAPKSELIRAYAELMETINCDTVVRLRDAIEVPSICGIETIVSGFEWDETDDTLSEIYTGNMKDFLESFNNRERETGWYRLTGYEEVFHDFTSMSGGTKLCFVL
jgi:hypothetical protein